MRKAQVVYPIHLSPLWDGDCWLQNGLGILSGRRNGCIEGKPGQQNSAGVPDKSGLVLMIPYYRAIIVDIGLWSVGSQYS